MGDVPREPKKKNQIFHLRGGVTFRDQSGKQVEGPPRVTSLSHMSKFDYSKIAARQERKNESAQNTSRPLSKRTSFKMDHDHTKSSITSPSNLDIIRGISDLSLNKPTTARPNFKRATDFISKNGANQN